MREAAQDDTRLEPLNREALAWIANSFAARGKCLLEGEFVLLGSLVETRWIERGDVVTIEQPGLGSATARIV